MTIAKVMAAVLALYLAGAPVAVLAAESKTVPCPAPSGALAAKPSGPVARIDNIAPRLAVPRVETLTPKLAPKPPLKLAPGLPPPTSAGAAKPTHVYVLDPEAGTVTFGDGQSGQRLPSGTADTGATYRAGAGAAGEVGTNPCQ